MIDSNIIYPILASIILSLISFIGVLVIPFNNYKKYLPLLVSIAAGAMIGDVFIHILPAAITDAGANFNPSSLIWIIVGICIFYLLETALHWHHHHSAKDIEKSHHIAKIAVLGDAMHNFLDGLGLAVAFAISPAVGLATTVSYVAHEIPQEICDYAIFINSGWSRKKALLLNFASGLTSILGAVIGIFLINTVHSFQQPIVMITAGSLLYIALADLIPESNNNDMTFHKHFRLYIFVGFLIGIIIMYSLTLFEGFLGL